MPILAKMAVSAVKTADSTAQKYQSEVLDIGFDG